MLTVMLNPYMFPNVIPFGGIMCIKIAIPQRIGRVVICYMLCKICLIMTHFTTVTFILLGHKNCRCTSLCIVPGVSNIHTIAPVFCIQSFVTGFINTSSLFFGKLFLFGTCTFIPSIIILLFLFLFFLLGLHLLLAAKCSSSLPFFRLSLAGPRLRNRNRN